MGEYQNLRISFTEGCEETMNVISLGTNYYRLDSTPLTAGEGVEVYFGDVIEAEKQKKEVLRFRWTKVSRVMTIESHTQAASFSFSFFSVPLFPGAF